MYVSSLPSDIHDECFGSNVSKMWKDYTNYRLEIFRPQQNVHNFLHSSAFFAQHPQNFISGL